MLPHIIRRLFRPLALAAVLLFPLALAGCGGGVQEGELPNAGTDEEMFTGDESVE